MNQFSLFTNTIERKKKLHVLSNFGLQCIRFTISSLVPPKTESKENYRSLTKWAEMPITFV